MHTAPPNITHRINIHQFSTNYQPVTKVIYKSLEMYSLKRNIKKKSVEPEIHGVRSVDQLHGFVAYIGQDGDTLSK